MKRLLAVILSLSIVLMSTFTVFADSDPYSDIAEFFLTWYCCTAASNYGEVANDPDKLVDYYDTRRGKLDMISLCDTILFPFAIQAAYNLEEASDGRYMVAELHRDQLEELYAAFNDYWLNGGEIRNCELSDVGITYPEGVNISGAWGYLCGSGAAAVTSRSDNHTYFHSPDGFTPNSNTIYVYNGSPYYPPIIYVGGSNIAFQNDVALSTGFYFVLGGGRLWYIGTHNSASLAVNPTFDVLYNLDTERNVTRTYCWWASQARNGYYCTNGSRLNLSTYDNGVSAEDVLTWFRAAIGLHVTTPDGVDSMEYTMPDTIPFDDNDNVTVMLPLDEPSQPVYLSPNTYNDYVTNGDIYNTTNTTNNIVNDYSINDFSSILNEYYNNGDSNPGEGGAGSSFDDSRIISKLNVILQKLDSIIDSIKNIDLSPTVVIENWHDTFNPEPCYSDFGECVTNNIPLIDTIKNTVIDINGTAGSSSAYSGFDSVNLDVQLSSGVDEGKAPAPSASSSSEANIFNGLGVNMSWYEPYRCQVRDILKLFCYVMGIGGIWRAIISVFGVSSAGGD